MTILRTTGLFQFGNQICIYWAGGGPPQCARLIRWHCCGSIHTLARSTKLLQCGEDRLSLFNLFAIQRKTDLNITAAWQMRPQPEVHHTKMNWMWGKTASRTGRKQMQHHTNQYEKRRPYLLSMQSFEMCVAAFEILLPAVPRRSIAMTMTLSLKHYEMHRGASSWI